jgi:hypothetical protein
MRATFERSCLAIKTATAKIDTDDCRVGMLSRTFVLNIEGKLGIASTEAFEGVDNKRSRGVQKMLA